jgi:ElaB/YqjD/DUF883 family membrane-anchored ribosome-binding protein
MNPTEAKFHEDLDAIASQLDLGVRSGKFSWTDVQDRLKTKTSQLATATDDYVRDYTWTSLGVVAGLSFALGWLLARR